MAFGSKRSFSEASLLIAVSMYQNPYPFSPSRRSRRYVHIRKMHETDKDKGRIP